MIGARKHGNRTRRAGCHGGCRRWAPPRPPAPAGCSRARARSSSASPTPASPRQFTEFSELVGKHPAVIETFRAWGADLTGSIKRWQRAVARPILHISTADPTDGHELISPRAIAQGYGDDYLMRLNYLFWSQGDARLRSPAG